VKTWGETFTASFSLGLLNLVVFLVGGLPIMAGLFMMGTSPIVGYLLLAIGIILVIGGILCTTALDTILLAALYIYAEEGVVPEAFDEGTFNSAFK
jgi:hypothetical protein